jgi:(1->4)-alpha-D-glucan 1-alpha-D-glucosylmutase
VPDIYQGDELVSLSLVDPDNRRPVDWQRRREALAAVRDNPAAAAATIAETAGIAAADARKLQLVVSALDLRRRKPDSFAGAYEPIAAGDRAVAYTRGGDILVAAEILPGGADTVITPPGGRWRDALHGSEPDVRGRIRLANLLDDRGIALLERY